jgi:hypothetical protein
MAAEIQTPVIDNIAGILNQWAGHELWRGWPTVAIKDQIVAALRDDLAANELAWEDARAVAFGMNKALALMEHFTGHPDGYRQVVVTVDLLKEKAAERSASSS